MPDYELSVVSRSELEKNLQNWFSFVPAVSLSDEIIDQLQDDPRIKPLNEVIDVKKQMIRGTEMGEIVHFARERDSNIREKWIVSDENDRYVSAEHTNKRDIVKAPRSALISSIRTHSGIRTISIDSHQDYLVTRRFTGDESLWEEWPKSNPASRSREFQRRKCNLAVVRRPDLASPGMSLFAFYSDEEFIPSKMLWCIKYPDEIGRKVLSIWFNSTISFLTMLLERAETRGSFSGWDKEHWEMVFVLDPHSLSGEEKNTLVEAFESVKDIVFPSLINQFKDHFPGRRIIDNAVLEVLKLRTHSSEKELDVLYDAIFNELSRLKKIVDEG